MGAQTNPPAPAAAPARPALLDIAAAYGGTAHSVVVNCEPDLAADPRQIEAMGRLAAEAVTAAVDNPLGPAAHVWIRLAREGGRLRLRVRDDGPGIANPDADPRRGRIDALARELGGRLKQGSAAFGGGEVVVSFPIAAPPD